MNMKFNQMIKETLSIKRSDQERVERYFRTIVSLVHSKSKDGKIIYNLSIETKL